MSGDIRRLPDAEVLESLLAQALDTDRPALETLFAGATLYADVHILLGSLADEARRAGHTWADLGDVLGVTRQAAQQRFAGASGHGSMTAAPVADNFARRPRPK